MHAKPRFACTCCSGAASCRRRDAGGVVEDAPSTVLLVRSRPLPAFAEATRLTSDGAPGPSSELWTLAQPGGRKRRVRAVSGGHDGNPVRHGRCLQMKRCPNCLSLWERPAAGRVRVSSAVVSATKAPSPRPSPKGRGRKIDDVQKGSYISNPSAEHHCHGVRRKRPARGHGHPGANGCYRKAPTSVSVLSWGRSDTKPRFVSFRSRKGGILPPTGRTQW